MTLSTPWGWRSAVGEWVERHFKFQTPWFLSPLWAWQNVSSHSQHRLDWAVIVMVCELARMCLWECVCVDWLWLNMFCGINSDYGWASLLCNQTNWLTWRVCDWTEFLLWLPLHWVLSTCQPGAKKWEARAFSNRRKNSSSGSSPSILSFIPRWGEGTPMTTGQIHSQHALTREAITITWLCWILESCQFPQSLPQIGSYKRDLVALSCPTAQVRVAMSNGKCLPLFVPQQRGPSTANLYQT